MIGEAPGQVADPLHPDSLAVQGEAMLSRQDFASAERLLSEACESFPNQSRLWGLLATTLWNIGRHEDALTAVDHAFGLTPKESFATQKGWMLFKKGDLEQAETVLRDAIRRFPDERSAYEILARVYEKAERWAEGAAIAEHASVADPANFDMRECWAICLLAGDRPSEALTVIEDGLRLFTGDQDVFRLQTRKAEAHYQLGDVDGTIDAVERAAAILPDNESTLEKLNYLLLTGRGRGERAKPHRARLQKIWSESLPDRLGDGLAELWDRAGDLPLPEPAAKWAWDIADQSRWEKAKWRAAAAWGREASLLMRRWWQAAPTAQLMQIDELVDKPDLDPLFAASLERGSYFLVGAHVGPTASALNLFKYATGNRSFRTIGSPDRGRPDDETLIPVSPNYISALRALISQIKTEAAIGMMGNSPNTRDPLAMDFLGRRIQLPLLVPKLIQRYGLPSFWCCPLWRNKRIMIELERLPDPTQDEPRHLWSQRWFAAYLKKLEAVMRGRPENLSLYAGIWANVGRPSFHNRRKAR